MTIRLKIDPKKPDERSLVQVVEILRDGGIVAFPTETFYGLGADARQEAAVDRIFLIKGRGRHKPLSLIVDNEQQINCLVKEIPAAAQILMHTFWPGALTLIFNASPLVSPSLTGGTGKIGIRISSHPIARLIARKLAGPLTATSANHSGGLECSSAEEVISVFGDTLDAVIDGGRSQGGLGSTILDVTTSPPLILREGAISRSDILGTAGILRS